MFESKAKLEAALSAALADSDRAWFVAAREKLPKAIANNDMTSLDISLAVARRKLSLSEQNHQSARSQADWTLADMARVLFLLDAKKIANDAGVITRAFSLGDEYEREAILRGLLLLDNEGLLKDLAVDACRTNVVTMMAAIAQSNPYPARYFSEHEFNQMVLKCLFLELDLGAVLGLNERQNPAMSRMCYDYLRERLAADRSLPRSIFLAISVDHVPEVEPLIDQYQSAQQTK